MIRTSYHWQLVEGGRQVQYAHIVRTRYIIQKVVYSWQGPAYWFENLVEEDKRVYYPYTL